jgi:uncharacterized protein YndB with AHSA1/START domain
MTPAQTDETAGAVALAEPGTIVVRRTIPATVDELFDAWLDADSLAQWMRAGPDSRSDATVDARVGGGYEVVMHHPDRNMRHRGEYRVIDRNRKLVFTWLSDATHHAETLVTVDFHVLDAGTEIVVTHERLPDHDAGVAHGRGWTAGLQRLEALYSHR